jgi:hypothetical protein
MTMSDSLMIEVTGRGEDRLKEALRLAPVDRINHVSWCGNYLVMGYEHDDKKPQKMCFHPDLMSGVVIGWLERTKGSNKTYAAPDWPQEPDIDGEVKKGWRLVSDNREILVHPHWMIYHK